MQCGKKLIVAITANTSWYIYNFRKNTIIALLKEGYEVIVFSPEDAYTDKIKALGCHFKNLEIDRGGKNIIKDVKAIWNFYMFYKKNEIAIALNFTPKNNIYSTIAASYSNVKIINNIAGLGAVFVKNSFLTFILKKLYKFSQKKASFVFFQNKEDKFLFDKAGIKISEFDILPGSGVDLKRFTPCEAPDNGIVVFALMARLLIEKGIIEYALSARELKIKYKEKVRFLLIGYIDEKTRRSITKEQIKLWVDEGSIEYLGGTDNIELIIKKVDCVVLPSFYREGVPKSLLEAAALGKPIVTTNNVGCRETVDDGLSGYLCEPKSVTDLKEKMEMIITHSHQERVTMGMNGRKKMESCFDENIVIDKYLKAIKKLCN